MGTTTQATTTAKSANAPERKNEAADPRSVDHSGEPGFENEGEGNRTAARRYNEATEAYSKSGRAEPAADAAKKALDGPEGAELREAEEEGLEGEPKS